VIAATPIIKTARTPGHHGQNSSGRRSSKNPRVENKPTRYIIIVWRFTRPDGADLGGFDTKSNVASGPCLWKMWHPPQDTTPGRLSVA
jgi:hypothetical protein